MKRMKKLTAAVLAVAMVAPGLMGCGGDAKGSDAKDQTSAGTVVKKGEDPDNPWMIGDPENPIELTVFLNHTWYGTESFTGAIPDEITKRTGIKLVPTKATDYTQLGVMASSGELPDLVFTSQMMDTLSDPNICYSYDELIDKYHVDWDIDQAHQVNAKAFSEDDHYYFTFSHASSNEDWKKTRAVPMVATVQYRTDMLKELGNPEIKNLDDLDNVFAQVKEKWPEVTPLVFAVTTWTLDPFKTWNNCTLQDFVLNDDGTCDITAKTEEYYNYLKYCNSLYQKGYINADNFSWESADAQAAMSSDKAFAIVGNTQGTGSEILPGLKEKVPDADLAELAPLSDYPLINSEIGWCGTFITKNNKNPEASIRLMQFLFSDEGQKLTQWGREGIDYTLDDRGLPVFSEEWQKSIEDNTNTDLYNTNFYFGGSKILEAEARCAVQPEQYQATNDAIRESYDNEEWYVYATPKTSDGEYKVTYDKMVDYIKTGQAKVILSADDSEFEKNYTEFENQLDDLKVDSLAEFMAPRLSEAKKLFRPE
ncbi:MAG: extracellular solute-binding protein [Lachnospiraceae bacterium]|nr:extracellular solute-binding protein [Lachnospiraceae bacterium]